MTGIDASDPRRPRREKAASLAARLAALTERLRADYDTRSVGKAEWDEAAGETD